MRKVTIKASQSLKNMEKMVSGNTRVSIEDRLFGEKTIKCAVLYLHDNQIAIFDGELLTIRDAGWQTVTTKERLNGVLDTLNTGLYISQKDWSWSLKNSKHETVMPWSGTHQINIGDN